MPDDRPLPQRGGVPAPALLIFDVNETLSDLSPMAERFEDVGAPGTLAATWFAALLRDGFALTAAGGGATFAHLAAGCLRTVLHGVSLTRDTDAAIASITDGFAALPVHPDVPDGLRALADSGRRMVTLSNGAAEVAEALLSRAGVAEHVERFLGVGDTGVWKPAPAAYRCALQECGVDAAAAMLVAVHPWDVDGAARAGLATAWVDRTGAPYPDHFRAPDLRVSSLSDLAARLT